MSFSQKVRSELLEHASSEASLQAAMAYGCLLFFYECADNNLVHVTRDEEKANGICKIIQAAPDFGRVAVCKGFQGKTAVYRLTVEGFTLPGFEAGTHPVYINRRMLKTPEQRGAFLAGAFYVCGSSTDPEKGYYLELNPPTEQLVEALSELLQKQDLSFKQSSRRGKAYLYTKDCNTTSDFLTLAGAVNCALEVMEAQVERAVKNQVNRRNNCDTFNIGKTMDASMRQNAEIRALMESERFFDLPEELQQVALLRMGNPELSLSELGKLLNPPMSRSGVYHRLEKISKFAQDSEDKN